MNTGLLGGIGLILFAIYNYYVTKTENLDWTLLQNLKVWGVGMGGISSLLYEGKDKISNLVKGFKAKKVDATPEVSELDTKPIESEDFYCLSYLMKRAKKASKQEAVDKLKEVQGFFYDIHLSEVKTNESP